MPSASSATAACAIARSCCEVVGVDDAHQPEVDEADAAVVEQQVVARVRVAGGAAQVVERAEEEAEDDLGEAVALGLAEPLDLLEAAALDQLGDEHAAAGEPVSTGGTNASGCPRQARSTARWFCASIS